MEAGGGAVIINRFDGILYRVQSILFKRSPWVLSFPFLKRRSNVTRMVPPSGGIHHCSLR